MNDHDRRTGVWFVGARGSVATTAMVGALAIRAGMAAPVGMVTESPELVGVALPGLNELVFGGHDLVQTPLWKRAEQLVAGGVLPATLVAAVRSELTGIESDIRGGARADDPRYQVEASGDLVADITDFRERHGLARVVVVDVSSTEPPAGHRPEYDDLPALERAMAREPGVLPVSSLYAHAAFRAGCPFVAFTPSTGARLPALAALAGREALPYAGRDGKTGQTLVRSALAPMFAARGLRVLSWSGTNLLGSGDGATLADPAAAESKLSSKQEGLNEILGGNLAGQNHIDYVPDLGEWKTAWDHVGFEGFLGTRMTMQVTWQGCDSALAAPLVLDLARLTARAHEAGEQGELAPLGFFFKDPPPAADHRLAEQYAALRDWAVRL